ncbi:glycosyl hydrolase 108 family protein [Flavobacterium sp. ZT3R25]|uniref:glycosyl hydrolase 108 family protein n=1 Tax=Flavobacterium galactosi TaxID=3398735 RepID=UPI003A857B35
MANFNLFLPELLKAEGGYQNRVSDRKGNTNSLGQMVGTKYGISAPAYEAYIKRPPTIADMKNLPLQTAVLIAKKFYWDVCNADDIENQSVANIIVDHFFNSGKRMFVKEVLKQRFGANIKVDSRISKDTITLLNASNPEFLHYELKKSREKYYRNIGGSNLKGWLNRLSRFVYEKKKFKQQSNDKPSYSHAWDWLVFNNKKAFK